MTTTEKKAPATRAILGSAEFPVRYSYLQVFETKETKDDDGNVKHVYSVQILIDKKDKASRAAADKAVEAAILEFFKGKKPANLKMPLRDGDEECDEKGDAVKGCWFFNCSSKVKPNVVGTEREEMTNKLKPLGPDEIKSGDYGKVSVNFFGFAGKSKGIGVGLGNIQKLKDGDPLGNQRSAEDDFGDLEEGFKD